MVAALDAEVCPKFTFAKRLAARLGGCAPGTKTAWVPACAPTSAIGTWQNRAHGAVCPQPAKADMRAFGRHSGFDPKQTWGVQCNRLAVHMADVPAD